MLDLIASTKSWLIRLLNLLDQVTNEAVLILLFILIGHKYQLHFLIGVFQLDKSASSGGVNLGTFLHWDGKVKQAKNGNLMDGYRSMVYGKGDPCSEGIFRSTEVTRFYLHVNL